MTSCRTAWGSHACEKPDGHDGVHVCGLNDPEGPCSEHDGERVRFMTYEAGASRFEAGEQAGWSDWAVMGSFTA